ncbi:MAG: Gfo/Idh/MocA family oxidoreductase [ANME-2 cluster archaeon]|nr:Gfo/Idh/MocA family oxidoreductase [ANME-2 cluster archaeon]
MRILIVGVGSIGKRHMENLVKLGHEVYGVDFKRESLDAVKHIASGTFESIEEALEVEPEVAFICTFSNAHIAPAIECAKAGCHIFIEKPLSLNLTDVDELIGIIDEKKLISMVGCNMRFHPGILYVHEVLAKNPYFKTKLWANLEFGFYLPFAKIDYESSYMANRSMGGNLIFDGIHELDYAAWFFGEPSEVICTKGILSDMKIDTEDYVDMILKFKSGVICNVHMDYLQHGYSRRCKVVCGEGTVVWDFATEKTGIITIVDKEWKWEDMKLELYYNQMYMDEIKYFMNCIENMKETFNTVHDSESVLRLALAANRSAESGMWEQI